MVFEESFKNVLADSLTGELHLGDFSTGAALMGAQSLYEATGDDFYLQNLTQAVGRMVPADGTIKLPEDRLPELLYSARVLFFLFKKTQNPLWQKTLKNLMSLLKEQSRLSNGCFCFQKSSPHRLSLWELALCLPFYLEYETQFHAKENYNDVYSQTKNVRHLLFSEQEKLYRDFWEETSPEKSGRASLEASGLAMMSLIDLYEISSEEVFEQHKQYADWMKEAMRGSLSHFSKAAADPKPELVRVFALAAYSILKACRLDIIHQEKYREFGESVLKICCDALKSGSCNQSDAGMITMAYSEFLKLKALDY